MRYLYSAISFFLFLIHPGITLVHAQSPNYIWGQLSSRSVNEVAKAAGHLGSGFGDGPKKIEVDASGSGSFSIPLLTVPGRNGLDFPISMRYTPGPKFTEEASWVGLGWDLDLGAVHRMPVGNPDAFVVNPADAFVGTCAAEADDVLRDRFSVTLPDGSGHVVLQFPGSSPYFRLEEWKAWDVKYERNNHRFIVTSEDGTTYVFGFYTLGLTSTGRELRPASGKFELSSGRYLDEPIGTWYLTAVLGPDYLATSDDDRYDPLWGDNGQHEGGSWIRIYYTYDGVAERKGFRYTSKGYESPYSAGEFDEIAFQEITYPQYIITPTHIAEFVTELEPYNPISEVLNEGGGLSPWTYNTCHFSPAQLPGGANSVRSEKKRRLTQVRLYRNNMPAQQTRPSGLTNPLQTVILSYYGNSENYTGGSGSFYPEERSLLKRVQLSGGGVTNPPYDFTYYDVIGSMIPTSATVYPRAMLNLYYTTYRNPENVHVGAWGWYSSALSGILVNPLSMFSGGQNDGKMWGLKTIGFPSGGSLTLDYESNRYRVDFKHDGGNYANSDNNNGKPWGAGARITSQTVNDAMGTTSTWTYSYGSYYVNGTFEPGLGRIWADPIDRFGATLSSIDCGRNGAVIPCDWAHQQSGWKVLYGQVTENQPDGSKIISRYKTAPLNENLYYTGSDATQIWNRTMAKRGWLEWQEHRGSGTPGTLRRRADYIRTEAIAMSGTPTPALYFSYRLDSLNVTNRVYDDNGLNPVTTSEVYSYSSSDAQLVQYKQTNSDGSKRTWDFDYAYISYNPAMLNRNMRSQLYSLILSSSLGEEAKSWTTWIARTHYGETRYEAKRHWLWKGTSPTDYVAPPGPSHFDSDMIRVDSTYDIQGNLINIHNGIGIQTSINIGFSNSRPIAVTQNNSHLPNPDSYPTATTLQRRAAYDSNTGLPTQVRDESGLNTNFTYDGLWRLTGVLDHSSQIVEGIAYYPSRTSANSWTFSTSTPNAIRVQRGTGSPQNQTETLWTYMDGLSRPIQTRQDLGSNWLVQQTWYDTMLRTRAQTKTFEHSGTASYLNLAGLTGSGSWTPGTAMSGGALRTYYLGQGVSSTDAGWAYHQFSYRTDPVETPTEAGQPGNSSRIGSGNTLRTAYATNAANEPFSGAGAGWYRRTEERDENGNRTWIYTDGWGRVAATVRDMDGGGTVTSPDHVTRMEYDVKDQLVKVTDPRGLVATWTYDRRGQLIQRTHPDWNGTAQYKYDRIGRLRFELDPNRISGTDKYLYYKYDVFDRLIETGFYTGTTSFASADQNDQSFPTSNTRPQLRNTWDTVPWAGATYTKGRLAKAEAWDPHRSAWAASSFSYNNQGQVAEMRQALPRLPEKIVTYTYDRQQRPVKSVYQSGQTDQFVNWYAYDLAGRLSNTWTNTVDNTGTRTADGQWLWHAQGMPRSLQLGAAQTVDLRWHIRDWISRINDPSSLGTDRFAMEAFYSRHNGDPNSHEWRYDASTGLGNLAEYTYSYDRANRLTEADFFTSGAPSNAFREEYTYDKAGNLTQLRRGNASGTMSTIPYSYSSGTNKLQSGLPIYGHDRNGNLTYREPQGGTDPILNVGYDWRNRATEYSLDGGTATVKLSRSAAGDRVGKISSAGTDTLHYVRGLAGEVLALYRNRSLVWHAVAGPEGTIGRLQAGTRYYYLTDHLGSVRATVNQAGTAVSWQDFYPYGLSLPGRGSAGTDPDRRYGWAGKELDAGAGQNLVDFGARLYDPTIGRWWGVDPLTDHPMQLSLSPYLAMWGNPVRFTDPTGLCPQCKKSRPNPVQGEFFTTSSGALYQYMDAELEWVRQAGELGEVTVTADRISPFFGTGELLQSSRVILEGANYLSGALYGAQPLYLNHRRALPMESKLGTFRSFSHNYRMMGRAANSLSKASTFSVITGFSINYLDYTAGNISAKRFAYRSVGGGLSIGVASSIGFAYGGGYGFAAGLMIDAGFYIGETGYDAYQFLLREISREAGSYENAMKKGWYPKR